jgi:hypothetical protein
MTRLRLMLAALLLAVTSASAALIETKVASLPTSGTTGMARVVTDGLTAGDCTTGGGQFSVLCIWGGSVWAVAGSGGGGAGDALVANPLSQFAATTSLQLKNTISDETGSGLLVFATSPTLTTPVLGVAAVTSINGLTITSSTGTLTIPNGVVATGPAATDTLVGKATTDILTNKTYDAEGTGNVLTIPVTKHLPFAGCNNATAAAIWDLPTSNAAVPACATGTNTQKGYLAFADGQFAEIFFRLPAGWVGAIDAKLTLAGGGSDTSGTIIPTIATSCNPTDGTTTDDAAAYNAAQAMSTITLATAQNRMWTSTKTALTTTGCVAGSLLHLKMSRTTDTAATAARYIELEVTYREAL